MYIDDFETWFECRKVTSGKSDEMEKLKNIFSDCCENFYNVRKGELEDRIDELECELGDTIYELEDRIDELECELEDTENERDDLEVELTYFKNECDRLKNENSNLKEELENGHIQN